VSFIRTMAIVIVRICVAGAAFAGILGGIMGHWAALFAGLIPAVLYFGQGVVRGYFRSRRSDATGGE